MLTHALISPENFAGLLIRLFTGFLFFRQGYDKVVRIGVMGVFQTVEPTYKAAGVPDFFIRIIVFFTSYVELLGGLLLIVGLLKYTALYLLGFDLLIVAIGMSIVNPVWDMQHVFPRLLLILFMLIFPDSLDIISLDHFIF
jgi:putative oxidoreductase